MDDVLTVVGVVVIATGRVVMVGYGRWGDMYDDMTVDIAETPVPDHDRRHRAATAPTPGPTRLRDAILVFRGTAARPALRGAPS